MRALIHIELRNSYLKKNGIFDIEYGRAKDAHYGNSFGIFEALKQGQTRRKVIMKSPLIGAVDELVCRTYNLDKQELYGYVDGGLVALSQGKTAYMQYLQ